MNKQKGITLIALVITIIVLLILAGISIASLTGENGILKKASNAGEQTKIVEYKEILIMIGNGLRSEKILEDLSNKEYMDRYQEAIEKEIQKGDIFEETEVERKSDETIKATTKEGYVYLVTEDEVKYLGKEGETAPPDLQEGNVNFILSPDSWTNQDVKVEIESTIGEYQLQYSFDGATWQNYKGAIIVKENGTIYTRLINELEETGASATKNIITIDKEIPNEASISFSSTTTDTTKSVTATVTQSDDLSGIDIAKCKYAFTIGNTKLGTEDETQYPGTFEKEIGDDLSLNCPKVGTYYLHVLSFDLAGNKRETISEVGVKSSGSMYLIQNGSLSGEPPTVVKGSWDASYTRSEPGSGYFRGNWRFTLFWANGYGSLSSVFWRLPVLSGEASVTLEYYACYGAREVDADVYLFGAAVPPTGAAVWGAKPYSVEYGDGVLTQTKRKPSDPIPDEFPTKTVELSRYYGAPLCRAGSDGTNQRRW